VVLFDRDGDGGVKRRKLEHCLKKKKKLHAKVPLYVCNFTRMNVVNIFLLFYCKT